MRPLIRLPRWLPRPVTTPAMHATPLPVASESPTLLRYLGEVQQRCSRQILEQQNNITGLEEQIRKLQHELLRRDAEIRALRQRIDGEAAGELICRTGCLSHDDHWRAAENCRLSGLPCHHAEAAQTALTAERS